MTLKLEWKKKLVTHTDRVKAVDLHPSEPWVLGALYSGQLIIYDYHNQCIEKSIEASTLPLRCARFIKRQNWMICGCDDLFLRVYSYMTLEKVAAWEAHSDYIRSLAVHSSLPLVLSSADDLTIKTWNWEKGWQRMQTFEGHAHYVMMATWSPRDSQLFASASLDRTVKIWSIGAGAAAPSTVSQPHFTLQGHDKGVNSVAYSESGDKPYLLSGSDDCTVHVWDYQTRQCLQVLTGHTKNVCHAIFHPFLPLVVSCSEDGQLRVWNSSTYRHEAVIDYDVGRVWSLAVLPNSNYIAMATDEGTMVCAVGSQRPIASMHQGKVLFVRGGTDIYQANVRVIDDGQISDGERLQLPIKEVGSSSVFPQSLSYHPNGRMVAICGDGEYSVLTAQALRNKAYGQAYDLVWSLDGAFAVRDESHRIRIFVDFEEVQNFQPYFDVQQIFGGQLLAIKGDSCVCFYDWRTARFVRRVEVNATNVYWSENGQQVVITTPEDFFVLAYDLAAVNAAIAANLPEEEDGHEYAFSVLNEVTEVVESGLWVEQCFVFVTQSLRLITYVEGDTETVGFLPSQQYMLGYVPESSRFYLADREVNIISYKLHLPYLRFKSLLARGQVQEAMNILTEVPKSMYEQVAKFLYSKGYKEAALQYAQDVQYRFEISLSLGRLDQAAQCIAEMEQEQNKPATSRWRSLADAALEEGEFEVAKAAFKKGGDLNGLLLLASTLGDAESMKDLAQEASQKGAKATSFMANFLLHETKACVDLLSSSGQHSSAAMFARVYAPSLIESAVENWVPAVASTNASLAKRIAVPTDGDDKQNYFPDLKVQLQLQKIFEEKDTAHPLPPNKQRIWKELIDYDFVDEFRQLGEAALKDVIYTIDIEEESPQPRPPKPHPAGKLPVSEKTGTGATAADLSSRKVARVIEEISSDGHPISTTPISTVAVMPAVHSSIGDDGIIDDRPAASGSGEVSPPSCLYVPEASLDDDAGMQSVDQSVHGDEPFENLLD